MPDDAIAKFQSVGIKSRGKLDVKGNDLSVVNEIANLPAKTSVGFQAGNNLVDYAVLPF